MSNEEWKTVVDWPSYQVSNLGRIANSETGRILRHGIRSGYGYVVLCRNGVHHPSAAVHRIVAQAFCGDAKPGQEVNHKDGNKRNNRASNLEWVSRSENLHHAANLGLKPTGERSHLCTKLNARIVRQIRWLYGIGEISQEKLGRAFKVSQTYVGKIVRNQKWKQI